MKLLSKWILAFGILGLVLTGCGTSDNAGEKTNGTDVTQNEEKENQAENTETIEGEQVEENVEGTTSEENGVRAEEQSIKYKVNGEAKEETAILQQSDNQHYSMYVLPKFELTAEEPNKDMVILSENGHIFMRIELLPENVDWGSVEENTKAQLEAVNKDIEVLELPNNEFYKDAVALETSTGNDIVAAYLIKKSEQPLKLTIFSQKDADYHDALLKMGETIMKEK